MKFENFQEAYLHNMKNVYLTPEFINEPRGNKSKEVLNLSFVIENPIERVTKAVSSGSRKISSGVKSFRLPIDFVCRYSGV